ncbi:hypothetical protein MMC30_008243 [Trapelia coarctata]|nr:hypothetical protein [Trapelia coarctata]
MSSPTPTFPIKVFAPSTPGPSTTLRATFDPNAPNSLISRRHAEAILGSILNTPNPIALKDEPGDSSTTTGSIDLRWHRSNRPKSFATTFSIVDALGLQDVDVILGNVDIARMLESEDKEAEVLVLELARLPAEQQQEVEAARRRREVERDRERQEEARREKEARERARREREAQGRR